MGPGADASDNCQRLQNAGGIGIAGTVDPNADYAYAPLFRVAVGLAARYPDPRNVQLFQAPSPDYPWGSSSGAFVTADRADGSCVVIDFRSMPAYRRVPRCCHSCMLVDYSIRSRLALDMALGLAQST